MTVNGTLNMSRLLVNSGSLSVSGSATLGEGLFNDGGTLSLTGGEIRSGSSSGTVCNEGGTLQLTGGTVTNTGSGPALYLSSAPAEWNHTAVIRSRSEYPVVVGSSPYVPDGYQVVQSDDGYYYLSKI